MANRPYPRLFISLLLLLLLNVFSARAAGAGLISGQVVDADTKRPLKDAIVTIGDKVFRTDSDGLFSVMSGSEVVHARAPGYRREKKAADGPLLIKLSPFTPKALYLSFFGIGSGALRGDALGLIEKTELNALVIDVKGDRGWIPYRSAVPAASAIGAQKTIVIGDMEGLLKTLKGAGIYCIARIVVFKDAPLALSRPELAVKTPEGAIWRDGEGLAWTDPYRKEARDYNLSIAEEAARLGFDEIQFDYIRFPDVRGLAYSEADTEENRVDAITGFLREARVRLAAYNVFLSADIFGYVLWNTDDTGIGQRLEDMAPNLDYLCPMLYPSGFKYGIRGYRNPVAYPYEIVYLSLFNASKRTSLDGVRFRPWLQAFRDYAFDRRAFDGAEIRLQIDAASRFGSNGFMLWNPQNVYSGQGLKAE